MNAHMWVRSHTGLIEPSDDVLRTVREMPGVVGLSPTIYEETLLATKYAQTGAQIKAVDPATIGDVSDITALLGEDSDAGVGSFDLARLPERNHEPGMLLGWQLSNKLQIGIGDQVFLMVPPRNQSGPVWMAQPRLVSFRVTGIFRSGFFEFDAALAVIDLGEAQRIFETGNRVSAIEVKLDDAFQATNTANEVKSALGGYPYYATTWIDLNGGLYKWLMIEKWFAFIVLSLIIVVAAFNIVSTLSMVVLDKTREIGILKAMGATAREISQVYVYQGFVVGVIGTLAGGGLGYFLCWLQDEYKIIRLPAELYQVSAFPIEMRLMDFVAIGSAALVICVLSAVYPAWKAARMKPVEAIRHE
jgi:lipoprotein-releasing system permease protein